MDIVKRYVFGCAVTCAALFFAAGAEAAVEVLDFYNVTGNTTLPGSHFQVAVTDEDDYNNSGIVLGENEVLFYFENISGGGNITEVAFDDGAIMGINTLYDVDDPSGDPGGDPNVDFTEDTVGNSLNNLNMDAFGQPTFDSSAGFATKDGAQENSIEHGQWLGVVFQLDPPGNDLTGDGIVNFNDVIYALQAPATQNFGEPGYDPDQWLRIGLHVQNIDLAYQGDSSSEKYVNNPPVPPGGGPGVIPEPASIAVWTFITLAGFGVIGYRRRQ